MHHFTVPIVLHTPGGRVCVMDVYCRNVVNDQAADDVYRIMVHIAAYLKRLHDPPRRSGRIRRSRLNTARSTSKGASASNKRPSKSASASNQRSSRRNRGVRSDGHRGPGANQGQADNTDNKQRRRDNGTKEPSGSLVTAADIKALHDTGLFTHVVLQPSQHRVDAKVRV